MKITCDACETKYSIGDDRVAGKVFKVRCKKCSHVIIVRGQGAEPVEPPREGDWHAIVDGAQVGPFDADELRRRREAGELDDESLVWREGFADWQPVGLVDELRADGERGRLLHDELRAARGAAVHDALRVEASRGPALHGERNETSVLFTLGNLARLAAPPKATPDAPAGTEGSGLIDIRSLARALVAPVASTTPGSSDGLPSYAPSNFIEPAVMVPVQRRDRDRRLIWALGAAVGAIVLLATILVVIVVGRDGGTRHAEAAQLAPAALPEASAVAAVALPPDPSGDRVARTGDRTLGSPGDPAAPPGDRAVPPIGERVAPPGERPADRADRVVVASSAERAAVAPASQRPSAPPAVRAAPSRVSASHPAPHAPAPHPAAAPLQVAPEACSEVSCAVSGNAEPCCQAYREKAAAKTTARDPNLPDGLDRNAIAAGLGKVDVKPCGGKSSARGRVRVSIRVAADGSVTDVNVKSAPDDALGSCVAAAARQTTFARTAHGGSFFYVWSF